MLDEVIETPSNLDFISKRLFDVVSGYVFLTLIMKRHTRTLRRRLKKLKPTKGRLIFIVDATLKRRRSHHVENVRRYHHGSGLCLGHKFVNFVVLDGPQALRLASLPVLTKKYARENMVRYRSEIELLSSGFSSSAELRA